MTKIVKNMYCCISVLNVTYEILIYALFKVKSYLINPTKTPNILYFMLSVKNFAHQQIWTMCWSKMWVIPWTMFRWMQINPCILSTSKSRNSFQKAYRYLHDFSWVKKTKSTKSKRNALVRPAISYNSTYGIRTIILHYTPYAIERAKWIQRKSHVYTEHTPGIISNIPR